jgi:hypothetical protein
MQARAHDDINIGYAAQCERWPLALGLRREFRWRITRRDSADARDARQLIRQPDENPARLHIKSCARSAAGVATGAFYEMAGQDCGDVLWPILRCSEPSSGLR